MKGFIFPTQRVGRQSDEQGDPPKGKEWELTTDEDDEHGYGNVFDIRPVASFVVSTGKPSPF